MKAWLLAIAVLLALDALYLAPGTQALFAGRTDAVMSDDTDPAALPYMYDQMIEIAKHKPWRLIYGSIYVENADPERGFTYWMPWSERIAVLIGAPFFALEQLSTFVVFAFLFANGLALFALARYMQWNPWVSLGLAIAWAFNCFTRARAKVHMAMVGTFHVPLIFLALLLIARGKSWRSSLAAALCLLLACTTIHYFVVTSLFLTPFFLAFLFLQPEARNSLRTTSRRLVLAALPAILFLGWNFAFPVPPDAKIDHQAAMPKSGDTPDGELHPFLWTFAAHPIDYLAADITLGPVKDWNLLRAQISQSIQENLGPSNTHERSNGIRWSLIILAAFAAFTYRRSSTHSKIWIGYFLIFAAFTFWLSLAPDIPFTNAGPSGWLYRMVKQVRVPSRAGVLVHFSALMLVGLYLNSLRPMRGLLLPAVFPLLMVIDYPPLIEPMPLAPMRPRFAKLQRDQGACGAGLYFPFVNNYALSVVHYYFLQQMRGSDCAILNGMQNFERLVPLTKAFPPAGEFLATLPTDLTAGERLIKIAQCTPLTWIAFDPAVPEMWSNQICARLGWRMSAQLCVSPRKGVGMQRMPDVCL